MKKISDLNVHSLIGGMTSDYFDFWCKECGNHINKLNYYSEDSVGVKLQAICDQCNREFVFKVKVSPPLVPIVK